jgi:hypothetical protein
MNAEERSEWAETRARGKGKFILSSVLLRLGPFLAVDLLIFRYVFKYGFTASQITNYLRSGETILHFFFDWLYFGLVMGWATWYFNERRFRKTERPG